MDPLQRFRRAVTLALGDRSPLTLATNAGLPRLSIRRALKEHEPKLSRAAEIAEAVGLELYIGPSASRDKVGKTTALVDSGLAAGLHQARDRTQEALQQLDLAIDDLRESAEDR